MLRLESHQTCSACPAYVYELYADGSWHYEGKDSVFMLGESGGYRSSEFFRRRWERANKLSDEITNSEGMQSSYRHDLINYLSRRKYAETPTSPRGRMADAIRKAEFFSLQDSYPPDLASKANNSEPVLSLEVDLDGRQKSVRFLAASAVPRLTQLLDEIMGIGEPFLSDSTHAGRKIPRYWIQQSPPFWSDPEAVLWYAHVKIFRPKTYGVILYKNDKATIYGWNHVAERNRDFQVQTTQLELGRVAKLLAALNSTDRLLPQENAYINQAAPAIVDGVFGRHHGDNRLLQKDTIGTLTGHSQRALEELKRIVDSLIPLLGPDDPVRARSAEKIPVK